MKKINTGWVVCKSVSTLTFPASQRTTHEVSGELPKPDGPERGILQSCRTDPHKPNNCSPSTPFSSPLLELAGESGAGSR